MSNDMERYWRLLSQSIITPQKRNKTLSLQFVCSKFPVGKRSGLKARLCERNFCANGCWVAGQRRRGFQGGNFSPFMAILTHWLRQNKEEQPKSLRTRSNSVVNVIVSKRQAVRPGSLSSIPERVKKMFCSIASRPFLGRISLLFKV